jgi:hypothetical protein
MNALDHHSQIFHERRILTPRQAAAHCSVSPRTIYRWSSGGRLHHAHTPEGALLICYASLFGCERGAGREGLVASARPGL